LSEILGTEPLPFFGITVILFGLAAAATGRALAQSWRPAWQLMPAVLLLAGADRFLHYALFEAPLDSLVGLLIAAAVLGLIMSAAYCYARARKMVQQYPWLYERTRLLGWRAKQPASAAETNSRSPAGAFRATASVTDKPGAFPDRFGRF
jgi:branched-chain amino acid transport system ATP-binding protein